MSDPDRAYTGHKDLIYIYMPKTALIDNEHIYQIDERQDCALSVTMCVSYRVKETMIDRCIEQTIYSRRVIPLYKIFNLSSNEIFFNFSY